MPDSGGESNNVVANIPFLFYDVIGRMFPGGFLIIGGMLSWCHFLPLHDFAPHMQGAKLSETSVGLATLTIGLAVLMFTATSTFLGFILAPLSNVLVEKMIWKKCSPLSL